MKKKYVCPSVEIADVELSGLIAQSPGRGIPVDDAVEATWSLKPCATRIFGTCEDNSMLQKP